MQSIDSDKMKAWLEKLKPQGVVLDDEQCEKLVLLDSMVVNWNRAAGLTGFQSDEERFDRYFGEALHASMWLPERGLAVDVGSGGGSPALPMAIHRPEVRWTLLEPNHKKTVFLQEASATLGLENTQVVSYRFQDFRMGAPVRILTTRGLALSRGSMQTFHEWLEPQGLFLALTGEKVAQMILDAWRTGWKLKAREQLAPRFQAVLVLLERA